jgi:hypothetical protein
MYIPEILICIGTSCFLLSAQPQDTEQACREHVEQVMIPAARQAAPTGVLRGARCRPVPQDPAA